MLSAPTFSVPYGGVGVVDQPAVAVHQVGHVLRHGEARAGDGEELGTARHPQLQHRLPALPHHGLHTLDMTEVGHVGRLEEERDVR